MAIEINHEASLTNSSHNQGLRCAKVVRVRDGSSSLTTTLSSNVPLLHCLLHYCPVLHAACRTRRDLLFSQMASCADVLSACSGDQHGSRGCVWEGGRYGSSSGRQCWNLISLWPPRSPRSPASHSTTPCTSTVTHDLKPTMEQAGQVYLPRVPVIADVRIAPRWGGYAADVPSPC
jgi:hypothetical protein